MFETGFIQELKDKNPIEQIIGQYVDLRKKGANMWACCPFHNEKTPSFSVNVHGQFYHCFGCGVGGDVITFVSEHQRLTKFEAIEYLANRAGMHLPSRVDGEAQAKAQQDKQRHYDMNKIAARFYVENLVKDRGVAKAYLAKRGIRPQDVKNYGIGFAPDAKDTLMRLMQGKGYTTKQLLDSRLIAQGSYGMMDKFRNRLMFPIIDLYGNVIAFGGRVLGEGLPKYMNSAESAFYNKRRHLFGLNLVKNQKPITHIILVEGYMDVVALSSFGVSGVVASLGTALTEQQANLIKRFGEDVLICYDADPAGQKAALRAAGILRGAHLNPRIIDLPAGQDPDDFIKQNGLSGFEQRMDKALLPHRYEVERMAEQYDLGQENQRRDFALAALRVVSQLKNSLDKEDMIKFLQVKTGYSGEVLAQDGRSLQEQVKKDELPQRPGKPPPRETTGAQKAEQMLLKLALNGHRDRLLEEMSEADFFEPFHQAVFRLLQEQPLDEQELQSKIEDPAQSALLVNIRMQSDGGEQSKAFEDCKLMVRRSKLSGELESQRSRLGQPGLPPEQRTQILEKINELNINLQNLQGGTVHG